MSEKIKIGAVQAEPAWLNLPESVKKVTSLVEQAGKDGVNVLGFSELFVPGYPWSIWTEPYLPNAPMLHEYMANSLVKDSPEMDQIREAVKKAGIFIVLGYSERDGDSLYISQSFIDPTGTIVLHRRKIKPTGVERSVWGDGQADGLINVVDSPFGGGFAMLFGPDGTALVDPLDPGEEGILSAEIELNTIDYAKQLLDVVGHYSRPDLLSLKVNLEPAKHVHYE
ncbi:hypothetical protein TrVFT333_006564 [Trichoderma virens FT-333]|nr:hypothetical protein TrVFT333_006564 [Trichoderma virens FT-333]